MSEAGERLLESAGAGDKGGVERALDLGAPVDARDAQGTTALGRAASGGHVEVLDLLLDRGADPGAKGAADLTPLHLAARDGQLAAVRRLVERGAITSERLLNDVLYVARMSARRRPEIVALLEGARMRLVQPSLAGVSEVNARLIRGAAEGRVAELKAALDAGADIEAPDGRGTNALGWAALKGHADAIRVLLERGARPEQANSVGWTALAQAAGQGQLAAVRALLEGGADPNVAVDKGTTPLMAAAHQGYPDVVRALRAAGASLAPRITSGPDEGLGARDLAIRQNHLDVAALLEP